MGFLYLAPLDVWSGNPRRCLSFANALVTPYQTMGQRQGSIARLEPTIAQRQQTSRVGLPPIEQRFARWGVSIDRSIGERERSIGEAEAPMGRAQPSMGQRQQSFPQRERRARRKTLIEMGQLVGPPT